MFGSEILDVVVAMAFLFAVLSLIATSAREVLEGMLQTRAIHLERGVRLLLGEFDGQRTLTERLYKHPLIDPLYSGDYPAKLVSTKLSRTAFKRAPLRSNLPAYIPARNFALALLDIAGRPEPGQAATEGALTVDRIKQQIDVLIPSAPVRRAVALALDGAGGDLEAARANLEKWFDSAMDRVSGVYRKETQWVLFAIGLLFAVALNVDTVRIASTLYTNQPARDAVVRQAEVVAQAVSDADEARLPAVLKALGCETPAESSQAASQVQKSADCTTAKLQGLGVPLGWPIKGATFRPDLATVLSNVGDIALALPGWLLTALAISLGAPFWFDLLNKLMVIRSTVKPHEKSPEEASEDRQEPESRQTGAARAAAAQPPAVAPPAGGTPAPGSDRVEADEIDDVRSLIGGKLDPQEKDA